MTLAKSVLTLSVGQYSSAGRKSENQDFHGALLPEDQALRLKGAAFTVADGISSSAVGRIAAETAVKSFLSDYYCTSDTWTVKTAASRVISASNSWLHAQHRPGYSPDRGHVCTFDALILKGHRAHLFHVGDGRIWRLSGDSLEQLTEDHRVRISADENYLGRALGLARSVDIDYRDCALRHGDMFVLTTDGVHEFVRPKEIADHIAKADDLDAAARSIITAALEAGSDDNLTIQIVRVDTLPPADAEAILQNEETLAPAPVLTVPCDFEGYRVLRQIHASHRSHIYLAQDLDSGEKVALKVPSLDLRGDEAYLRRFAMEEWIARRLNSPHVLKAAPRERERQTLFAVTEYVEGQTLRQWMIDHPAPGLETVRDIVDQIIRGIRAFHRKEMVHQDLRPENIMVDTEGTVKIIDFGAVRIAGVTEARRSLDAGDILGTHQYTAPEVFLGYLGTTLSDQFALGVIAYEMLTGRLPYGDEVARATSAKTQAALRYRPAARLTERVPDWVDAALCRAVHPTPGHRYDALSTFLEDLRRPNPKFISSGFVPFAERDPVRFWQIVSLALALLCVALAARLFHTL